MPVVSRQMIVPYTPEEMYALVNAVEDYPQFFPGCYQAEILRYDEDEVEVVLTFSKMGVHKSFTTRNRLQKDKIIEIRLVDGPFEHLEGLWRFNRCGDGCQISFDLEFQVGISLANFAFGSLFHQIANSMVDAFCKRAKTLYGER